MSSPWSFIGQKMATLLLGMYQGAMTLLVNEEGHQEIQPDHLPRFTEEEEDQD